MLPDEDWPPSIGRHESNLVLIEHPRHPLPGEKKVEEILKDYVGGNVDKIVKQKQEIKYEKVFGFLKPQDNPNFKFKMLIDGAPGVGKTVLCRRFCKDWAAGEILEEFPLVWLLHLRDPAIAKAKSIDDLFQHYDEDLLKEVVQYIKKKGGAGNLLIFDGLDELSKQERTQCSLFLDIIRGRVLPNCSVVVTSRPYASQQLQEMKIINRHVEVVGFTKDQIKECISQNITENAKAEQLIQALKQRLDVLSLCYTPLNCAIMLYIYQQEDYQLPKTLTQLYTLYMIHTLKRSVSIHFQDLDPDDITDLKHLMESIDLPFKALSKMAFQGLQDEQLGFTTDQLPQECKGGRGTKPELLGLMSASKFFSSSGRSLNYQFTHLTVQEFLAAWHAATQLSVEEQNRLFQEKWDDERFRMMLLFLSGISGLKDKQAYQHTLCKIGIPFQKMFLDNCKLDSMEFKEIIYGSANCTFFLVHQLFESQNTCLSPILADSLQELSFRIRDLFQCIILSYFLSTCNFTWRCLELRGLTPQMAEVMQSFSHANSSVKCLSPCSKLSYSCDTPNLSGALNIKQLTSLHIETPNITCNVSNRNTCLLFKALAQNTTLQNLVVVLPFESNKEETEALRDMLAKVSLQYLGLTNVTDLVAKSIAAGLAENNLLKTLDISMNFTATGVGVSSIFRTLERNTTLETLRMSNFLPSPSLMLPQCALPLRIPMPVLLDFCFGITLYNMLMHNSTITELDVSKCCFPPMCYDALISALKENSSLKKLGIFRQLPNKRISEAFADMLSKNHSLTELNIMLTNFHHETLARGLLDNNTLNKVLCTEIDKQSITKALAEKDKFYHPQQVNRCISLLR